MVKILSSRKLMDKVFKVETFGTLREVFLSETNEDLVRKYEVEYFFKKYGLLFKEIHPSWRPLRACMPAEGQLTPFQSTIT